MVSKKKLNFGFSGYQIPVIPKAPRSARKRCPCKKLDDDQICAFELLAAVAGKLLLESESSASSNADAPEGNDELTDCRDIIKREQMENDKTLNQGSCVESTCIPKAADQEKNFKNVSSKPYHTENKSFLEHSSTIIGSNSLTKDLSDVKMESSKEVNADAKLQIKVEGGSSDPDDPCDIRKQLDDDSKQTELTMANACSVKAPIEKNVNNSALINSDSSVQLPLYRDPVLCASFVKSRNNVKLGVRDDDEKYFGCYRRITKIRTFKPTSHSAYRRIRKMLTSRHWKVAPKLKDCESSYSSDGMKSFNRKRKNMCGNERHLLDIPSKKRKFCDHSFAVAYDQEASSKSISNKPAKGINRDIITSPVIPPKGTVVSASVRNHQKKDPNVKLSIKSFKVPELYIEVPETETIGSLKRTVMEAVTAILGSGLRVGVVLQGKKVRDDNRTLQQAGISQNGNLDTLGFTLEPSFTKVRPLDDQKLSRRPPSPILELGPSYVSSETKLDKHDGSNHELEMSPTNPIDQSAVPNSKALAVVPPMNAEALAVVPVYHKNRHSELSQRRTRRPFSVAEVEALVEAVEQLGTGRWRDVKMRAFDNAYHRTYVDLKDKWKTLVHTASIAPQQRRGELVPQELLDRVLAAHAYWSQHQAKQHAKQLADPPKILDAQVQNDVSAT
ncbi:telomere repeat-binding protein 4-like isoform X1 [Lycium barbarum]|uniref:telomere repeat-binding protein 4-like isoform X1 n=1 Tax=Lycium barbarum TaxID=112863 RepID=UPI00293EE895|nr:telomere repeat-binding protein 4-like isoform X1 [Lycium barbarum]XP_060175496.1 telomere repeat-binding protein 4-like isoform X1 [Lycium barbarum]